MSRRKHAPNKQCALNNECAPDNPILRVPRGINQARDLVSSLDAHVTQLWELIKTKGEDCVKCPDHHEIGAGLGGNVQGAGFSHASRSCVLRS